MEYLISTKSKITKGGELRARVVRLVVQHSGTESCATLASVGRAVQLQKRVRETGEVRACFLHWLESGRNGFCTNACIRLDHFQNPE